MRWRSLVLAVPLATALLAPAHAQLQPAPEASSGLARKELATAKRFMVAAANPLAVEAGYEMLKAGGSAADAAVAVQWTLGLVEPQSSGIGGGAFVVYWDNKTKTLTTFDGRETAPMAATVTLFQDEKGEPLKFIDAVVGGRSVGTPGTPRLMEVLHRRHGRLAWGRTFEPAMKHADEGFIVSPRLATLVAGDVATLAKQDAARAYFLGGADKPIAMGSRLKNPDYAATLRAMALGGADAFYSGDIARDIVRTVREAAWNPGVLSEQDLATYRVKERSAVCAPYRGHEVCGMGPPSSGAIALGQILGLLEGKDLKALGPASPEAWRLIGDASRLAFADRERFVGDMDFTPVPVKGLLDRSYLAERAKLLDGQKALEKVEAGSPKFSHARADAPAIELPGTSHVTIVDGEGNALSMTTTIEAGFGSRLFVRGFLLNNELTDFSFRSHVNGVPVANRVEPGKRPRSSMTPTIVLKDGQPVMALGSPGGAQIIGYVAKALIARLDWGMDMQQAISLPNMLNRGPAFELEKGTDAEKLAEPLKALGYEVRVAEMTSGLQGIEITPEGLKGGADPRREGIAKGD